MDSALVPVDPSFALASVDRASYPFDLVDDRPVVDDQRTVVEGTAVGKPSVG